MIKSLLLLSAFLASTCQVGPFPPGPPQPVQPPTPWPDTPPVPAPAPSPAPSPAPAPSTGCDAACARFAALGCPEAKPTAKGASCVTVCKNAEESGVISLNPDCVVHADSCASATACSFAVKQ